MAFTRFLVSVLDFTNNQDIADATAFVLTGFPDELPAAVGRQVTLVSPESNAWVQAVSDLAQSDANHVELVAHGVKDGLNRAWFYDRTIRRFQSDRNPETIPLEELLLLAGTGLELTFTVVAAGTGARLANDRDGDGTFDRTELDLGFDPGDPFSNSGNAPPHLAVVPPVVALHPGMTLAIPFTATDANQPTQSLHYNFTLEQPAGATLNPTNGILTWTPALSQGDQTNWIGVEVIDDGTPALHQRALMEVRVAHLRAVGLELGPGGNWTPRLFFRALVGQRYQLQFKNRLEDSAWIEGETRTPLGNFAEPLVTTGLLIDSDNHLTTNAAQRVYRVLFVP